MGVSAAVVVAEVAVAVVVAVVAVAVLVLVLVVTLLLLLLLPGALCLLDKSPVPAFLVDNNNNPLAAPFGLPSATEGAWACTSLLRFLPNFFLIVPAAWTVVAVAVAVAVVAVVVAEVGSVERWDGRCCCWC